MEYDSTKCTIEKGLCEGKNNFNCLKINWNDFTSMDNYKDLGGNIDASGLYVSPQIVKVIFQMFPLLINIYC